MILTCSFGDTQLAESTQQLLLRMADYTRQTVELTRQELHVVVMNQVNVRMLLTVAQSVPSCPARHQHWGQTSSPPARAAPLQLLLCRSRSQSQHRQEACHHVNSAIF